MNFCDTSRVMGMGKTLPSARRQSTTTLSKEASCQFLRSHSSGIGCLVDPGVDLRAIDGSVTYLS